MKPQLLLPASAVVLIFFIGAALTFPLTSKQSKSSVPSADLYVTNTGIKLPPYFFSANAVDLSMHSRQKARDITQPPIFPLIERLGFNVLTYNAGQTSQKDHVIIGDTIAIGGSGMGYNCNNDNDRDALKGDCSNSFLIEGKRVDFFNSFINLVKKLKCNTALTLNVVTGTWAEHKWKCERAHPKYIILGQEVNLKSSSHFWPEGAISYCAKANALSDSVHKYFPGVEVIADAAPVFTRKKSDKVWNKTLARLSKDSIFCTYLQLDEGTEFTGNLARDTALLSQSFDSVTTWFNALQAQFHRSRIAITQFNCSETFSDKGAIVYPGSFLASEWIVRNYAKIFSYNSTHNNAVVYCSWQNVRNITGKDRLDVNGQTFSVLKNLFHGEATYLNVSAWPGLLIFGVKSGSIYKLICYNYSGKSTALPKTVSLDGRNTTPEWNGIYLFSEDLLSTSMQTYTPSNKSIAGFSIAYCELK